jgi:hypothetical protein
MLNEGKYYSHEVSDILKFALDKTMNTVKNNILLSKSIKMIR